MRPSPVSRPTPPPRSTSGFRPKRRIVAERIGATLVRVPGAAHEPHREQPAVVNAALSAEVVSTRARRLNQFQPASEDAELQATDGRAPEPHERKQSAYHSDNDRGTHAKLLAENATQQDPERPRSRVGYHATRLNSPT